MFIEFNSANRKAGWIEVICGSMFSGKTEELIRRMRRAQIANQRVEIFKPGLDKRYAINEIVSHNQNTIPSMPVHDSQEVLQRVGSVQVVGIDEAQFFDDGIVTVAEELANRGIRVIVAGLDMDFRGNPFGPMPQLLAVAEFVTKVHAICQVCGSLANYSYRHSNDGSTVLLGEKDVYEPRCRTCFLEGEQAKPHLPVMPAREEEDQ
ncbi:MAG: thymidine kinase [Bacteroidia bacterium]|nr:thymidine kinase [Bacteroidia bacterium]